MKLATAIPIWQAVAEWEREHLGVARSTLTMVGGSGGEVEVRLPVHGGAYREAGTSDEIDLLELADVAAGNGAGLYLHSTGGLVIR